MKKIIVFVLVISLIVIPFSPTFINANEDNENEIAAIEDIINLFPEIEDDVRDVLSNETSRSTVPEYVYTKSLNECDYVFTIYTDDSFTLLIGYAPEVIVGTKSTYSKLFSVCSLTPKFSASFPAG